MASRSGEQIDTAIRQASVDSGRAMASAGKGAGGETEDNELYKLNQVFYRAIPSLSTVSKRSLQRANFQLTDYKNLSQQTLTCVFNTGENFINGAQSFLYMQFGIPLPGAFTLAENSKGYDIHAFFGPGGLLSIIDEVWLTAASGTEICREQNKGLQIAHYLHNTLAPSYIRADGIQGGHPSSNMSDTFSGKGYCRAAGAAATFAGPIRNRAGVYSSGGADNTAGGNLVSVTPSLLTEQGAVDVTYVTADHGTRNAATCPLFAIPLNHLLGCFDPYLGVLLPGIMLAGATLNIRIKNLQEPLIITGSGIQYGAGADTDAARQSFAQAVANSAEIKSIYIMFDCYQMNDSVVKKINQISAGQNGLTVMFDTFDWSSTNAPALSVEAQVSQARSRIKMSFCVVRDNSSISNPFIPSLCAEGASTRTIGPGAYDENVNQITTPPLVSTYQAILGSLYFPQQPIQNLTEMYINQLYMFGKAYRDDKDESAISFQDFCGARGRLIYNAGQALAPTTDPGWCFPYGMGLYGFTAERSSLLQLTGLTLSNARLLRHRFTFSTATVSGGPRIIDVFTQYTRQAKIFLAGRIVMKE